MARLVERLLVLARRGRRPEAGAGAGGARRPGAGVCRQAPGTLSAAQLHDRGGDGLGGRRLRHAAPADLDPLDTRLATPGPPAAVALIPTDGWRGSASPTRAGIRAQDRERVFPALLTSRPLTEAAARGPRPGDRRWITDQHGGRILAAKRRGRWGGALRRHPTAARFLTGPRGGRGTPRPMYRVIPQCEDAYVTTRVTLSKSGGRRGGRSSHCSSAACSARSGPRIGLRMRGGRSRPRLIPRTPTR